MSEQTIPAAFAEPRGMRTFMIIWLGELISVIGSGLTYFALGVWVFEQTRQATPFALAMLSASLPRVLLAPLAGVVADRWNRRWVMIVADCGAALTTLSAFFLFATGNLQVWHIYPIALLGSIFNTFQEPAYTASVTMLVAKKGLGRASGMVQMSEALSLLVGPVLAGLIYVTLGFQTIFLIDFLTFLFAVGALLFVRIPQPERTSDGSEGAGSLLSEASYGWRYLWARPGLFGMLLYFALVNFLMNLSAVLTAPLVLSFAKADSLGVVQSVFGLAMLIGSIVMSVWGGPKRRMLTIYICALLVGVALIIIGLRPSVALIAVGFFIFLFNIPIASGSSRAIWQSKIAPDVQGRVFASRNMISGSMMPLAFLLAGPLADKIFNPLMLPGGALANTVIGHVIGVGPGRGVSLIFSASGVLLLIVTAAAYLYPRMRNVEDELPDVMVEAQEEESPAIPHSQPEPAAA